MQYTSSSFAQLVVGLFGWALRPKTHPAVIQGLFPSDSEFSTHVDDVVLDRAVLPAAHALAGWQLWFRWLQQGSIQAYLIYILATVIALLAWHVWNFWDASEWQWLNWSGAR
jgi:hypothetical protein